MSYQLTAPLAYIKVPDLFGITPRGSGYVGVAIYRGAIIPHGIHPESLQRLIDLEMVVDLDPRTSKQEK